MVAKEGGIQASGCGIRASGSGTGPWLMTARTAVMHARTVVMTARTAVMNARTAVMTTRTPYPVTQYPAPCTPLPHYPGTSPPPRALHPVELMSGTRASDTHGTGENDSFDKKTDKPGLTFRTFVYIRLVDLATL